MNHVSVATCTDKTQILFPIHFFPPEGPAVYEVMWKNTEQPEGPQMRA
jgi:hypothetical protein